MDELDSELADPKRDPRYLGHSFLETAFLEELLIQLDFVLSSACGHIRTHHRDELVAGFQEYVGRVDESVPIPR